MKNFDPDFTAFKNSDLEDPIQAVHFDIDNYCRYIWLKKIPVMTALLNYINKLAQNIDDFVFSFSHF